MIFNDLLFLLIFLPLVVFVGLYCLSGVSRVWSLVAASLLFYGASGILHAATLVAAILWVYAWTRGPGINGSKLRLAIAIAGPLGNLFVFKYSAFAAELIGLQLALPQEPGGFDLFEDALLPAGISFFSIQMTGFAIDRYRDRIASPSLMDFSFFVSFFPQLVAGPIVRWPEVAERIAALRSYRLSAEDAAIGLRYIILGLAFKVLLADSIAQHTDSLAATPEDLRLLGIAFLVPSYSFQIYFDFYGYSLIAIGLARWFGIRLPQNFDRPYSAKNPRDFWRRWHMTLSYWIRDYVYVALGGNRRYALNILIVFVGCGLWHGAGISFLIWGFAHAVMVIAYARTAPLWDRMPGLLQICLTFLLVSGAWLLFLFDTQSLASIQWSQMISDWAGGPIPTFDAVIITVVSALACYLVRAEELAHADLGSKAFAQAALWVSVTILVFLFLDRSGTFIYFRF